MRTRRIDASYAGYKLQIGAHDYARRAARGQTASAEFLKVLGLESLIGEPTKDRRRRIEEHFEQTGRQIRRQAMIDLVACFEADLFRIVAMASSKVRHTLDKHYDPSSPLYDLRSDLARTPDDFSNLGGYKRLLARTSSSETDPRRDLWEVISYRDFLAHGQRWQGPAVPPTVETAYAILAGELARIEARR